MKNRVKKPISYRLYDKINSMRTKILKRTIAVLVRALSWDWAVLSCLASSKAGIFPSFDSFSCLSASRATCWYNSSFSSATSSTLASRFWIDSSFSLSSKMFRSEPPNSRARAGLASCSSNFDTVCWALFSEIWRLTSSSSWSRFSG